MVDAKWTLLVHGGAGSMVRGKLSADQDTGARAGLSHALDAGSAILNSRGNAVDAICAAVTALEDDAHFNAGHGAVFTFEGINELDASVMDGMTRSAGAIAGARFTRNPVLLARAVMEKSPHVMLSCAGADTFSREQGLDQVDADYFATPERWRQLEELKAKKLGWYDIDMKYGTVGAVAMDSNGSVAAATSTGGLTGKRWGRIGDSPIIGAGNYADNRAGAVSATGAGEFFIRLALAHEICARMRMLGDGIVGAADHVIGELGQLGGTGGVIATAPDGTSTFSFNTPGMYRGRATSDGDKYVAIYGDE